MKNDCEKEYLFAGFGVSYETDGKCVTACMLKDNNITGSFIIELYKKIEENIENIAITDFKNALHLATPVKALSEETAAPCQAAFNDNGITGKEKLFNKITDISIAAYLLNPLKDTYLADDIARDYLGLTVKTYAERFGKSRINNLLSDGQKEELKKLLDYAGELSYIACLAFTPLTEALKEQGMYKLFREIEMPAAYYLYQMEREGVKADKKY